MLVHSFFLELAQQLGSATHEEAQKKRRGRYYLILNPNADRHQQTLFHVLVSVKKWLHDEEHVSDQSTVTPYIAEQVRHKVVTTLGQLERSAMITHDREKFSLIESAYDWWHEVFDDFIIDHQLTSTPA